MRELPLTCVLCAHMQTFDVRKICSCYENCSKLESRQGRGGGGGCIKLVRQLSGNNSQCALKYT